MGRDDIGRYPAERWYERGPGRWPKPLLVVLLGVVFGLGLCTLNPRRTADLTTADAAGDEAATSDGDGVEGAASDGASPASPTTALEAGGALPTATDAGEPEQTTTTVELLSPAPLPADYVPGEGFTRDASSGTFYSTYGVPPEAVRWMESRNIIFNQPLPEATPTTANSEVIASRIEEIVRGERLYGYGSGFEEGANAPYMIFVDSDIEQFTEVVFRPQTCGADSWWAWTDAEFDPYINGAYEAQGKRGVPIPADFAMNGDDGDFHLMVYDWRADVMIELWKAMPSNLTGRPGIEACWGGVTKGFAERSRGVFPFPVGVDAAGFSAAGLTVTLEDVRRGEIRHAIGVSSEIVIDNRDAASFSYPANRNDGECAAEPTSDYSRQVTDAMGGVDFCLYEGQYLRLPADYDVEAIAHPYARMIARAGRDYGFVVHDVAGCFCVQAESSRSVTVNGLSGGDPWDDVYGGTPEWEILWQIDWSRLEVLPRDWNRPDGHRIPCAVPPGHATDAFPMANDPRCQLPTDPYGPG